MKTQKKTFVRRSLTALALTTAFSIGFLSGGNVKQPLKPAMVQAESSENACRALHNACTKDSDCKIGTCKGSFEKGHDCYGKNLKKCE